MLLTKYRMDYTKRCHFQFSFKKFCCLISIIHNDKKVVERLCSTKDTARFDIDLNAAPCQKTTSKEELVWVEYGSRMRSTSCVFREHVHRFPFPSRALLELLCGNVRQDRDKRSCVPQSAIRPEQWRRIAAKTKTTIVRRIALLLNDRRE